MVRSVFSYSQPHLVFADDHVCHTGYQIGTNSWHNQLTITLHGLDRRLLDLHQGWFDQIQATRD
jgi:hypothetical protein